MFKGSQSCDLDSQAGFTQVDEECHIRREVYMLQLLKF